MKRRESLRAELAQRQYLLQTIEFFVNALETGSCIDKLTPASVWAQPDLVAAVYK